MPYDFRRVQNLRVAEVPLPFGGSRKSINKACVDYTVVVEAVHINEPERFASPGNLGHWPAYGSPPVVLCQREALAQEEVRGVELVGGQEIVYVAVQLIGARFRGIGDKTTASVPVLCGKSVLDDRHFLHRRVGYRAFLRPLMTFGITEGGAIKPVFRGHGLAAVDSGSKLAAAEDRVAVRLHGHKAGLQLQ